MKKLALLTIVAILIFALAGCGVFMIGKTGKTSKTAVTASVTATKESATATPVPTAPKTATAPVATIPKTATRVAATKTPGIKYVGLKILSSKISKDYNEKPVIIIEYEFTNKSGKVNSFENLVNDAVYQNGIECTDAFTVSDDGVNYTDIMINVKPNAKFVFKKAYFLRDATSPVEVECKGSYIVGDAVTFLNQIIKLK